MKQMRSKRSRCVDMPMGRYSQRGWSMASIRHGCKYDLVIFSSLLMKGSREGGAEILSKGDSPRRLPEVVDGGGGAAGC